MTLSAFEDKTRESRDEDLDEPLGRSVKLWRQLFTDFEETYAPVTATWKYPGQKYGWTLQLKRKSRSLFYMTPCHRYFIAATAFGEKAAAVARDSNLPEEVMKLIDDAPKFAEGRAIRLEVRKQADLAVVLKLAAIKMGV